MKLKLEGDIFDSNNKKVGDYAYSFTSCRYSFMVNKAVYHFFERDELISFLEKHGYHV